MDHFGFLDFKKKLCFIFLGGFREGWDFFVNDNSIDNGFRDGWDYYFLAIVLV